MDNLAALNNLRAKPQLDLGEALKGAKEKLTQFTGRSRRSEYWWCYLATVIVNIVASFSTTISIVVSLLTWLAMIPLTFRRLHDTGRSGWWYGAGIIGSIVGMIVIIGSIGLAFYESGIDQYAPPEAIAEAMINAKWAFIAIAIGAIYSIVMLVLLCLDSEPGPNRYGDSPKYVDTQDDTNNGRTPTNNNLI